MDDESAPSSGGMAGAVPGLTPTDATEAPPRSATPRKASISAVVGAQGTVGQKARAGATAAASKGLGTAVAGSTGSAALGKVASKAVTAVANDPKRVAGFVASILTVGAVALLLIPTMLASFAATAMASVVAANANYDTVENAAASCGPVEVSPVSELATSYTPAQLMEASKIVGTASQSGLGQYAAVIAVAAAINDSDLTVLDGQDDRYGVFAKRTTDGWTNVDGLKDTSTATTFFLGLSDRDGATGLTQVEDWGHMSVAEAAQSVQHSSNPMGYQSAEADAQAIVAEVLGLSKGFSCTPSGSIGGDGEWVYPLPLGSWSISSPFNPHRIHPVSHTPMPHNGVDLAAPYGTPVYAVAAGTVTMHPSWGTCGNAAVVVLEDPANSMQYCHMSSLVAKNGHVEAGDLLGYVGSTGASTGNHLHLEIHIGGVPVNPLPVLAEHGINM